MAEVIGVISGIVSVASAGIELYRTLSEIARVIKEAPNDISLFTNEVKSTADVLLLIRDSLEYAKDSKSDLVHKALRQCPGLLGQCELVNLTIKKSVDNLGTKGKEREGVIEKLTASISMGSKWAKEKKRIIELRGYVEALKSTLILLLLALRNDLAAERSDPEIIRAMVRQELNEALAAAQTIPRLPVESLLKENQESSSPVKMQFTPTADAEIAIISISQESAEAPGLSVAEARARGPQPIPPSEQNQSLPDTKDHTDNMQPEATKPYEKLNILILGQTGVGKSTLINAFVNYLSFETLDDAVSNESLKFVVPCSFSLLLKDESKPDARFTAKHIKIGSLDNEDAHTRGQSVTRKTVVYPLVIGNTVIRLIDTPGIGETHSIDRDREHTADILSALRSFNELHGILILLRANSSSLSVMFRYCVEELLSKIHRNAVRNIVFGFTNTRALNYTPGDAYMPLQVILNDSGDAAIDLSQNTVYCFDSESFRFVAAYKSGVLIGNIVDSRRSWQQSAKETARLFHHFRSLPPHQVKNTLSLNNTRELIMRLTRPMAEITHSIAVTIQKCESCIRELADAKDQVKDGSVGNQLKEYAVEIDKKEAAIKLMRKQIEEYKFECGKIQDAAIQFSMFLKRNSITPYNDAWTSYIDHLIEEETLKVNMFGTDTERLNMLKSCRKYHEQGIHLLKQEIDRDADIKTLNEDEVKQLLNHLYTQKHWGKILQDAMIDTEAADTSSNREQPYHFTNTKENSAFSWL